MTTVQEMQRNVALSMWMDQKESKIGENGTILVTTYDDSEFRISVEKVR